MNTEGLPTMQWLLVPPKGLIQNVLLTVGKAPNENKQLKASQPTKCSECKHLVTFKHFNSECGLHGVAVSMGDYCSCGEHEEGNNGSQNSR